MLFLPGTVLSKILKNLQYPILNQKLNKSNYENQKPTTVNHCSDRHDSF